MKLPSSSATNLEKPNLRHFLKTQDFSRAELQEILDLMKMLKDARRDNAVPQLFAGKTVGMIFEQPSTRTRVSFEAAATILGGHAQFLSPNDIHLGSKESLEDTGKVLSRMVDVIMARVDVHSTVSGLAVGASVPVINGLCDWLHPTQMMADIFTMIEHLPEGKKIDDLKVAFIGDATNVSNELAMICTKFGIEYAHVGPKKYHMNEQVVGMIEENCAENGGTFVMTDDINAVKGFDILVADSFYWFGQEAEKEERLATFMPEYIVDQRLMDLAGPQAMFMHCLPANDKRETTREVMDGDRSVIMDEAENRLTAQMALLVYFTHKDFGKPSAELVKKHEDKISGFLASI